MQMCSLKKQRDKLPLFDTRLLTAGLETGLRLSWEVHAAYGSPYHIVVPSQQSPSLAVEKTPA